MELICFLKWDGKKLKMTKQNEKPREFWIDDSNGYVYRNGIAACLNEIHVIEYSAYESLKQENEKLREERNDYMKKTSEVTSLCLKMRKCLEFYADANNWLFFDTHEVMKNVIPMSDVSYTNKILCGGMRARQALKDVGE